MIIGTNLKGLPNYLVEFFLRKLFLIDFSSKRKVFNWPETLFVAKELFII